MLIFVSQNPVFSAHNTEIKNNKMTNRNIFLGLIISAVLACSGIAAQKKLVLFADSGHTIAYNLGDIQKITFTADQLIISNNNTEKYENAFADIRKITFETYSAIDQINTFSSGFVLSPVPATDHIQLQFSGLSSAIAKIQIIDIQGKMIVDVSSEIQAGNNSKSISISDLKRGVYLCRLTNGNSTRSKLFIKN